MKIYNKYDSVKNGFLVAAFIVSIPVAQAGANPGTVDVIKHWTSERIKGATPRDLVIDPRGLGYLRKADGSFVPYGHQILIEKGSHGATPRAKPSNPGGSTGDSTAPVISNMNPATGSVIGSDYTFAATITDASGVKSVSFVVQYPDGVTTQTFIPSAGANDTWSASLSGFSDGNWSWWVVAKDGTPKGGNAATSATVSFAVDATGGGSGGGGGGGSTGGDTVINSEWTAGGAVQTAGGRIYFEMPSNSRLRGPWNGYVCSGTVVVDEATGRSVILTAAHCVYDDVNKVFARNVLFIPNQAGTSASGTDLNCSNDPLGCWVPSFGVVDRDWTIRTFPNNIPYDYAYYVVSDSGAHAGAGSSSVLDDPGTAGAMPVSFVTPYTYDGVVGVGSVDFTHALGYSYSDDPNFMYCAEDMTVEGAYFDWWLSSCGLSGGASGGSWVQSMDLTTGNGPVISVNSWGYTDSPGMAGPRLSGNSAACLFGTAKATDFLSVPTADGAAGVVESGC